MMGGVRKTGIKIVTFILFGLLILSFAVWGVGDIVRGPVSASAILQVDDTKVSPEDFTRSLQQARTRLDHGHRQPAVAVAAQDLAVDLAPCAVLVAHARVDGARVGAAIGVAAG